ncbi:hypothetical protein [Desulfosporosinus shakirovi]|uniref:hypothetical protein n=1 Tax=Desulfosporosinus shakirovi TaxID=2885154 RepID=UPI001E451CD0|nr:hypothetical protein [Desulfosporosinus sp. SRJS8]MCB8817053.1 hypothetical protein [Desulfosporosinus sp. SRJS8]
MERISSFAVLAILSLLLLLGCNRDAEVLTTDKINPIDKLQITEMIIENSKVGNITVSDKNIINQTIIDLAKVKVVKLSPEQEIALMDNGERVLQESTYIITLENDSHIIKSSAVLLSEKELILNDVKTMSGNDRTVSYLNIDDEETLKYVNNLYNLLLRQKA